MVEEEAVVQAIKPPAYVRVLAGTWHCSALLQLCVCATALKWPDDDSCGIFLWQLRKVAGVQDGSFIV